MLVCPKLVKSPIQFLCCASDVDNFFTRWGGVSVLAYPSKEWHPVNCTAKNKKRSCRESGSEEVVTISSFCVRNHELLHQVRVFFLVDLKFLIKALVGRNKLPIKHCLEYHSCKKKSEFE